MRKLAMSLNSFSQPFPPTALRRRHTQTVGDSTLSYKTDNIIVIKNFLNSEGHQNPISGSKVTEGVDFAYWWSFSRGGCALQPAQRVFFLLLFTPFKGLFAAHFSKSNVNFF